MYYTNKAVALAGGWAALRDYNQSISLKREEVYEHYLSIVLAFNPSFPSKNAQDLVSYAWENGLTGGSPTLNVYNGANPDTNYGAGDWELGARYVINETCTLVGFRVWNQGTQSNGSRVVRLWDSVLGFATGTINQTKSLDAVLPAGWSTHTFTSPVTVSSVPDYFVLSQNVVNNLDGQSKLSHAEITTADGEITLTDTGGFHATPTSFPGGAAVNVFYGLDLRYQA
jgi:hypothetical protein